MGDIGDMMAALIRSEDAQKVTGGAERERRQQWKKESYPEPVVIYRGKKDIGKDENSYGKYAGDDVREYVACVDQALYGSMELLARDLKYNNKTSEEICEINPRIKVPAVPLFSEMSDEQEFIKMILNEEIDVARKSAYISTEDKDLWTDMELLTKYGIAGEILLPNKSQEMGECFRVMMEHFKTKKGATLEHADESDVLYRKIKEHRKTQLFVTQSMNLFLKKLFSQKINGDLNKLKFQTAWRGEYEEKYSESKEYISLRDQEIDFLSPEQIDQFNMYELFQQTGGHPVYDDLWDYFFGLGITIHDIWALKVQIENLVVFKSEEQGVVACSGNYVLTIYDNFGLDDADIQKIPGSILYPFWAWYMLQHYKKFEGAYIPFINQITITYNIADYVQNVMNPFRYGWEASEGSVVSK